MQHTKTLFILLIISLVLTLITCGGGGGVGGGDKEVTITYNANGATSGSVPASQKTLIDQSIAAQTNSGNLERTGYIFDGWNYNDGHIRRVDEGGQLTPVSDMTLYARWVEMPTMISIPGRDIKMSRTEVTIELYCMLSRDYYTTGIEDHNLFSFHLDNLYEHDKYPVSEVGWYEAVRFCNDLSKLFGLTPVYTINGKSVTQDVSASGFRLPTVEEWQYAAAGDEAYIYAGSNNINDVAWIDWTKTSWDASLFITHPVAQKKANGYGLYDMSGNAWEWCWDIHFDPEKSDYRAIQGGSVCSGSEPYQCCVLYTNHYKQVEHDVDIGIRLVCKE